MSRRRPLGLNQWRHNGQLRATMANVPDNIAVLRRRALDVVRQDTSKGSLSMKLKRAGWDEGFLCSILNGLKEPTPER